MPVVSGRSLPWFLMSSDLFSSVLSSFYIKYGHKSSNFRAIRFLQERIILTKCPCVSTVFLILLSHIAGLQTVYKYTTRTANINVNN